MIDAPGPWGSGPFTLVEGYSSLDNEQATISRDPFAATWLPTREDRTPHLRLAANTSYWNKARGPRLEGVTFRNDLSVGRALELVCTTEGEVDILTEVPPEHARRVEESEHAKLVSIDAMRCIVGIVDRDAEGLPLDDRRARQALNLAVDRGRVVREGMFGRAEPLAGLTPPSAVTLPHRLSPYAHDPDRAAELWREAAGAAGGSGGRPLRLAATSAALERVARIVAADLEGALGVEVEVRVYPDAEKLDVLRRLAEKSRPWEWDVLLHAWSDVGSSGQTTDAPPLELHRGFVGRSGEFRAGPVVPGFEELYEKLVRETSKPVLSRISYSIDKFVYEEALALFLCAPQALYAVNKQVDFTPYRTTFELAECQVSPEHWSRRRDDATPAEERAGVLPSAVTRGGRRVLSELALAGESLKSGSVAPIRRPGHTTEVAGTDEEGEETAAGTEKLKNRVLVVAGAALALGAGLVLAALRRASQRGARHR